MFDSGSVIVIIMLLQILSRIQFSCAIESLENKMPLFGCFPKTLTVAQCLRKGVDAFALCDINKDLVLDVNDIKYFPLKQQRVGRYSHNTSQNVESGDSCNYNLWFGNVFPSASRIKIYLPVTLFENGNEFTIFANNQIYQQGCVALDFKVKSIRFRTSDCEILESYKVKKQLGNIIHEIEPKFNNRHLQQQVILHSGKIDFSNLRYSYISKIEGNHPRGLLAKPGKMDWKFNQMSILKNSKSLSNRYLLRGAEIESEYVNTLDAESVTSGCEVQIE
eukprot:NODE_105_length_19280_cov_0.929461.p6 type:complete len:277 gc:universal NODE_105_length_19280_cov_0.929461:1048-1878(+)